MNEVENYFENISIDITDVKNREKKLKGLNEIDNFFKREQSFWNCNEFKNCPYNDITRQSGYAEQWIQAINFIKQQLSQDKDGTNDLKTVQQIWDTKTNFLLGKLRNKSILFSDSLEAQHLKNIAHKGTQEVDGAWNYFFNNSNLNFSNKNYFQAYLRVYEFERGQENGISGIVSAEQTRMKNLIDELNKTISESIKNSESERHRISEDWNKNREVIKEWVTHVTKEHEDKQNEANSRLGSIISTHEKKLLDIEDTYTRKLELEKPIKLWEKRVIKYRNQAYIWFSILTAASITSILLLLLILKKEPHAIFREGTTFMLDPSVLFAVIILATIVSFAAFLIRISAKIALSSMHLSRDAEEREQLTRVYLGLKMENKINQKDEALILDALFSRAQTGLLKDDSSPTMPGINTAFEKIICK